MLTSVGKYGAEWQSARIGMQTKWRQVLTDGRHIFLFWATALTGSAQSYTNNLFVPKGTV